MSKKKKIIISAVSVGIVLIGIILTIILVNIKRFNMSTVDEFVFNHHTRMQIVGYDQTAYTNTGSTYNNGTTIVTQTGGGTKLGIYSYVDNKFIAPAEYDVIASAGTSSESVKSYFKLTKNTELKNVNIIDEKGLNLEIFSYDANTGKTFANIKTKNITLTGNKKKVNAKIKNKFVDEAVEIIDAKLTDTKYYKGRYHYEIWTITTADGIEYKNLYKLENNRHNLVQTINNEIGISLDTRNIELIFLTDGRPMFLDSRIVTFDGDIQSFEYYIYDINFNEKGCATLREDIVNHTSSFFRLGNSIFVQFKIPATEDKYEFAEIIESPEIKVNYYNLETKKIDLKNGRLSDVNFDYLINNVYSDFNIETILISASKIKDKKLANPQNLLINERLQTKELNYEFNHIKKINDDRYITSIDGTSNFNLIDKGYNLILRLENYTNIFATNDTIIVSDSYYSYICNLDGVIIKKYVAGSVYNIHDSQYYLRKITQDVDGISVDFYYLEQLGLTNEIPLYTYSANGKYTYRNNNYDYVRLYTDTKNCTLIITSTQVEGNYTYDFFNIDGTCLYSVTNQINGISGGNNVTEYYSDADNVVMKVDSSYYTLNR